jgi:hypothetical protein
MIFTAVAEDLRLRFTPLRWLGSMPRYPRLPSPLLRLQNAATRLAAPGAPGR